MSFQPRCVQQKTSSKCRPRVRTTKNFVKMSPGGAYNKKTDFWLGLVSTNVWNVSKRFLRILKLTLFWCLESGFLFLSTETTFFNQVCLQHEKERKWKINAEWLSCFSQYPASDANKKKEGWFKLFLFKVASCTSSATWWWVCRYTKLPDKNK